MTSANSGGTQGLINLGGMRGKEYVTAEGATAKLDGSRLLHRPKESESGPTITMTPPANQAEQD
jgi:hypothetical protein